MGSEARAKTCPNRSALRAYSGHTRARFVRQHSRPARASGHQGRSRCSRQKKQTGLTRLTEFNPINPVKSRLVLNISETKLPASAQFFFLETVPKKDRSTPEKVRRPSKSA